MWRNYVTVGVRALVKNKTYAFINILGLAIGLAACLMILLYVRYETSYDEWLADAGRTFQLQDIHSPTPRGGVEMRLQMTSYAAGRALIKDFPQIEHSAYVAGGGGYVLQNGQASLVENSRFTDSNLLNVLDLPLVYGNRATALQRPRQLIISETQARRYFGPVNPVGRTLTLVERGGHNVDYQVGAVFRDIPANSHLAINIVARFDPNSFYADTPFFLTSWNSHGGWFYVKLRPGADVAQIHAGLPAWERRNIPDDAGDGPRQNPGDDQDWRLMNVRDVHLGDAQEASMRPGNDRSSVVTFAVIAALILGMACVNFTNLATARASQRAREVALRKVLGANRKQLIVQFLGESVLVAMIAMLIALGLVELLLPAFNAFLGSTIEVAYFGTNGLLLPVFALVLIVGAAGGLYPAFYLSRFQPAQILKANKSSADSQGSALLRNVLVVGQFAVSIGLIICTAVIYSQTVYARTLDAGYQRDGLLQVDMIGREKIEPVIETLRDEIGRIPGVTAVGRTTIAVATQNNSVTNARLPGRTEDVDLGTYGIDPDFFPAMGIRLLAGRNFDAARPRDDATTPLPVDPEAERALARRGLNVILTESAARRLGWSPQEAIGKEFGSGLTLPEYGLIPSTVIGVVADARFRSIRDPLQPILYYYQTDRFNHVVIRFQGSDPARVREQVEAVWKRIVPDVPFRAQLAEDRVNELYNADEARARLFGMFAGLSIVVGCLGLFGLAAFTAERRTKEIGIRKVLGARTRDVIRLLAWQFSKPVLIANLIAWPVAWWTMRDWLNTFDARISFGIADPWPFLLAGGLALVIAIGTIAGHAFKVARANPILALRYE